MGEAAKRLQVVSAGVARRLLQRNNIPLVQIHPRAYAVEETELAAFMTVRRGRGRPRKEESDGDATR
jgi:hypothetical protein